MSEPEGGSTIIQQPGSVTVSISDGKGAPSPQDQYDTLSSVQATWNKENQVSRTFGIAIITLRYDHPNSPPMESAYANDQSLERMPNCQ